VPRPRAPLGALILTALRTHLPARLVRAQLDYLRALAPGSRFVVCHGGRRSDFDELPDGDALWIDDPTLRGHHFDQSLNGTLRALHDEVVADDPRIDFVYLVEFDHLILSPDFEAALLDLAGRFDAGLLAKNAAPRNDTNWSHHLRYRDDPELARFFEDISRRDDPAVRYGSLGPALLLRRDALGALCALDDAPPCYFELFVPTAVYHLGFDVVDVDAVSDLYASVRWLPEFTVDEALAARRAGRLFVHPFKRLEELPALGKPAAA
jgi:hypothetical protein